MPSKNPLRNIFFLDVCQLREIVSRWFVWCVTQTLPVFALAQSTPAPFLHICCFRGNLAVFNVSESDGSKIPELFVPFVEQKQSGSYFLLLPAFLKLCVLFRRWMIHCKIYLHIFITSVLEKYEPSSQAFFHLPEEIWKMLQISSMAVCCIDTRSASESW